MSLLSTLGLAPKAAVIDHAPPASINRLIRQVADGTYHEAERLLLGASPATRSALIEAFSALDGATALAHEWVDRSASSIAYTVLGASMISAAWEIRGGGYADDVDKAAWKPFMDGLNNAAVPLLKAARLDTTAADPYAWLITAEVGKCDNRDLIDEYFAEACARVPMHWSTHYRYFMATTDKWGGSHKEMFRFAYKSAEGAPRGSMLYCLTAMAYCEYALALEGAIYKEVRGPSHAARISASLYAWLDASPATLESKLYDLSSENAAFGVNHFAVACYLCGANSEAKALVASLREEITEVPWCWIADGLREDHHTGFVHDRVQRELARA